MQHGTLQHLHSTRRPQSYFQHPCPLHCHNKPVLLLAATQRCQSLLNSLSDFSGNINTLVAAAFAGKHTHHDASSRGSNSSSGDAAAV